MADNNTGIDFARDPSAGLFADPTLVQVIAKAVAAATGHSNASFRPLGQTNLAPAETAVRYYSSELRNQARLNAVSNWAGTAGLPTSLGMVSGMQLALSTGPARAMLGSDIPKMGDLSYLNRSVFGGYNAMNGRFGENFNPITSAYNTKHIGETSRQSDSFTRSFMGMAQNSGTLGRNTGVLGRFSMNDGLSLLHGEMRRGSGSNLVRYTGDRSGNGSNARVNKAGVQSTLDMYNALADISGDDKTPETLQKIMSTISRSSGTPIDPSRLKHTFKQIAHMATTFGIASETMFEATVATQHAIKQISGMDVGLGGARSVVQRGISAAQVLGISDVGGITDMVNKRVQFHASAMTSSGASALTYLHANKHLLTRDMQDKLQDPKFLNNAANVVAMARTVFGDKLDPMLRDKNMLASASAGLTQSSRDDINRAVGIGADAQLRKDAGQTMVQSTINKAVQMRKHNAWYTQDKGSAEDTKALLASLNSDSLIFDETDKIKDKQSKAAILDSYNVNIAAGYSPSVAMSKALASLGNIPGMSEGITNLKQEAGMMVNASEMQRYSDNKQAYIISAMASSDLYSGVVDQEEIKALIQKGPAGIAKAEAMLKSKFGKGYFDMQKVKTQEALDSTFRAQKAGAQGAKFIDGLKGEAKADAGSEARKVVDLQDQMLHLATPTPKGNVQKSDKATLEAIVSGMTGVFGKTETAAMLKDIIEIDGDGIHEKYMQEDTAEGLRKIMSSDKFLAKLNGARAVAASYDAAGSKRGITGRNAENVIRGQVHSRYYDALAGSEIRFVDAVAEANKDDTLTLAEKLTNITLGALTGKSSLEDIEGQVFKVLGVNAGEADANDSTSKINAAFQKSAKDDKNLKAMFTKVRTSLKGGDPKEAVKDMALALDATADLRKKALARDGLKVSDDGSGELVSTQGNSGGAMTIDGILTLVDERTAMVQATKTK